MHARTSLYGYLYIRGCLYRGVLVVSTSILEKGKEVSVMSKIARVHMNPVVARTPRSYCHKALFSLAKAGISFSVVKDPTVPEKRGIRVEFEEEK